MGGWTILLAWGAWDGATGKRLSRTQNSLWGDKRGSVGVIETDGELTGKLEVLTLVLTDRDMRGPVYWSNQHRLQGGQVDIPVHENVSRL